MAWLRLDEYIPENSKVQLLSPELFRFWINVLCVSKRTDGKLTDLDDAAYRLHMPKARFIANLERLRSAKLTDMVDGSYCMHDWDQWQYKVDSSKERVRKFRDKKRLVNDSETVTVTAPVTLRNALLKRPPSVNSVDAVTSGSLEVKAEDLQSADGVPPPLISRSEFPKTIAEIRKHDAAVDETFVRGLANRIGHTLLSHPDFPQEKIAKATTDFQIAKACHESFATGPPGHRAGLLLNRVPSIIVSWGLEKET